jgi:hypothetical protein
VALVRIETLGGRSQQQKHALMDAVHSALIDVLAVPVGDPTLRVVEHRKTDVQLPRVPHQASEQWTLIEITLFAGRSQQTKRASMARSSAGWVRSACLLSISRSG